MLRVNGVVPPPAEGVATQNPSNRQICPAPDAVAIDGIDGILGAGRRETTGWRENRREQQLIGPNQGKAEQRAGFLQNFFHRYNIFLSCLMESGRMSILGGRIANSCDQVGPRPVPVSSA